MDAMFHYYTLDKGGLVSFESYPPYH